ncbi:hypothetical protein A8C56_17265 [Niabella ginsenosidivorans]|uniref:Uncharacterized protein n=1 Tax=Niabella ginsenosidivorans TaxID=1176587 RepID=A0A1A9I579_9BACT|nr:hypothetical protein A8C56_17265 [Niabella ginsenosidivorans]
MWLFAATTIWLLCSDVYGNRCSAPGMYIASIENHHRAAARRNINFRCSGLSAGILLLPVFEENLCLHTIAFIQAAGKFDERFLYPLNLTAMVQIQTKAM